MSLRVLIAGCGYVGTALARLLARDGDDVLALRRGTAAEVEGVTPLRADLTDRATLAEKLPPDVDVLFYTAAPDASSEAAYRAAYVDGLGNVVAALRGRGAGPRRLILTTSTAVYAQDDGEEVDESSPTRPERFEGRVLLEAERIAHEAGTASVVARFGGIYGPGRNRLIEQVRRGEATLPAAPAYTNRIHRDDCAGVLRHLARLEAPAHVYLGVDHDPADRRDVVAWLAARLSAPPPPAEPPPAGAPRRASGKRCRNARLVASGYVFRFPTFREGYEDVLSGRT